MLKCRITNLLHICVIVRSSFESIFHIYLLIVTGLWKVVTVGGCLTSCTAAGLGVLRAVGRGEREERAVGRGEREERTSLPASVNDRDWDRLRSSSGSIRMPWASSNLCKNSNLEMDRISLSCLIIRQHITCIRISG